MLQRQEKMSTAMITPATTAYAPLIHWEEQEALYCYQSTQSIAPRYRLLSRDNEIRITRRFHREE